MCRRMLSKDEYLCHIHELNEALAIAYKPVMRTDHSLNRQLVSFQASKQEPHYRWYKYKEAFSAALVQYVLKKYHVPTGKILDPFAGSGTTLFAGSALGYAVDGIELLPVGQQIISARQYLLHALTAGELTLLKQWRDQKPWQQTPATRNLNSLRITRGAYPQATEELIKQYLTALADQPAISQILIFTLLCILESISYTRKDGQYLRWDYRSGRNVGKNDFDKGQILAFDEAITAKLHEIITDFENNPTVYNLFYQPPVYGPTRLFTGSCLTVLPTLRTSDYTAIHHDLPAILQSV